MSGAWTLIPSPVGALLLTTNGMALTGIWFEPHDQMDRWTRCMQRDDEHPVLLRACAQLAEYFAGQRREFDLPLAPAGTRFQLRVWDALRAIPYGRTTSYGQIARQIGLLPSASRAVGTANGSNPIPIIVPCHRVIGADGSLTGYGGGLDRKRLLLDLESDALF
jgi:methylated-DNA-[protein]-cysteine S-methyltransferase